MEGHHNSKERLQQILKKYVNGTATEEEIKFLDQYDRYIDQNSDAFAELTPDERAHIGSNLRERITKELKEKPIKRISWAKYAAAAVLFFFSIATATYIVIHKKNEGQTLSSQYGQDVLPGSNKATITLSDGKRYELSANKNEVNITDKGITYADGSLVTETDNISTAVIEVPNGGIYNITLSDGTKVYLNSATTLHYPVRFTGDERKVELKGEGYFEVAHNPQKPFIVSTGPQELKVLGTHFNIQAYPNEKISSTLLEGSVELNAGGNTIKLTPGRQAIFSNNSFSMSEVSTDDYTAWTRSLFAFNNIPLSEIFQQMERWYDVEIEFPNAIGNEKYFMEIPKDRRLSEVLASLSALTNIKFSIAGRRVTVRQ